jgi:hypothetical protein
LSVEQKEAAAPPAAFFRLAKSVIAVDESGMAG